MVWKKNRPIRVQDRAKATSDWLVKLLKERKTIKEGSDLRERLGSEWRGGREFLWGPTELAMHLESSWNPREELELWLLKFKREIWDTNLRIHRWKEKPWPQMELLEMQKGKKAQHLQRRERKMQDKEAEWALRRDRSQERWADFPGKGTISAT